MSLTSTKISKVFGLVGLYLFGPLFLALTDPRHLPLPLLIVPFVWLFITIFISVALLLRAKIPNAAKRRRAVLASAVAALPVLLLVFESIHQLSLKDVLIVVALLVGASFYMLKADFIKIDLSPATSVYTGGCLV